MISDIEQLFLNAGIKTSENFLKDILLEMKMKEAGIQLASEEIWKALQKILKKATGNKTKDKKYVIQTKTSIYVEINKVGKFYPICIISGDYDTKKPNSLLSQIYGGLKHFSSHFNNIQKLFNKNYRTPNSTTSTSSFESFCLAAKEINNILNDPIREKNEVIYQKNKQGQYDKAIIQPTIQYNNTTLTFKFVIRLPLKNGEIAFLHTAYPLNTTNTP